MSEKFIKVSSIKYSIIILSFLCVSPVVKAQTAKIISPKPFSENILPQISPAATTPTHLAAQWKAENDYEDVRGAATAVPHNSPTFVSGFVGNAFSFQAQSYLTVPYVPLYPNNGDRLDLTDLTVEGWIKPSATSGVQFLVAKTLAPTQTSYGNVFALYLNGNRLVAEIRRTDNTTSSVSTAVGSISANTWYHVAFTYDRETAIKRIYLNGIERDSNAFGSMAYASETGTWDLSIAAGRNIIFGGFENYYNGLIDELSLYHRDLSSAEIAVIYARGANGKLVVGADIPPDNFGWWTFNRTLSDASGSNNDAFTLSSAFNFYDGFVNEAINAQPTEEVFVYHNFLLEPNNLTVEAWVKLESPYPRKYIIRKSNNGSVANSVALYVENNCLFGEIGNNSVSYKTPAYSAPPEYFNEQWRHVALTFDDQADLLRVFVDGESVAFRSVPVSIAYDNSNWEIGGGIQSDFPPLIDEVSVYSRAFPTALSGNEELKAIYYAGRNGKKQSQPTPTGNFVQNNFGNFYTNFSQVTAAGETSVTPLAAAPSDIPGTFQFLNLNFEISTTAVYAGNVQLCLTVPWDAGDPNGFNQLKIMHKEAGVWVDRTNYRDFSARTICGTVTSLSPFVVARQLVPTASSVTVSGRVTTVGGRGIFGAHVALTNQNGETHYVLTNPFGYFRLEDVSAGGGACIVNVYSKRYRFAPQVININEDIENLNFVAE